MAECSLIESSEAFSGLRAEWEALFSAAGCLGPCLTFEWADCWWRQFHEGRALKILVVRSDGRTIALFPLVSRRVSWRGTPLPTNRLEWMMTGEDRADEICSEYLGPLVEPGFERVAIDTFVDALLGGRFGHWDFLSLKAMGGGGLLDKLVDALGARGVSAELREEGRCCYARLPSSFEAYLSSLDADSRYVVNRALRELKKFASGGPVSLKIASDASELKAGRDVLHRLHESRWEEKGHAGVFKSRKFSAFHDELMARAIEGKAPLSIELMWLEVRGEALAVVYNFVVAGRVFFYQGGRRTDLPKAMKPGIALHAMAIERAIGLGQTEYDFLSGPSRYKEQLATGARKLFQIDVRRVASPAGLALELEEGARRTRSFVEVRRTSPT